ncbi:NEAT domain-containing protein [Lysinibacillus piscis]|uniref:NEAT domain-containing protein n=1 Tax=Lysinibacillus piscis TaxID=2518931 RepID=A0ABQ5NH96_9BACI|nr:NEAT domain-containing protein [Lysinibacillus sp. KH24]GLC87707.1 hypothetical protein LYSBPC_08340 [Lysinibacillus sp. KH24]
MILHNNLIRVTICSVVLCLLVSPFLYLQVKAETAIVGDGHYQVELSFSQIDGQQENMLQESATLDINDGQYQLSVWLVQPELVRDLAIEQLGQTTPIHINTIENLVQFDVADIEQPIIIHGLKENTPFSQSFQIKRLPSSQDTPIEGWDMEYTLLMDGKEEPSIMNSYVEPVAKIIERNGSYFARMTILQSAWVTGLMVNQQEPTLISLVNNVRIVEFPIADLTKSVRMWVQVDIPDIAYHHQYFVHFLLNQQQVANRLQQPQPTEQEVVEQKPSPTKEMGQPTIKAVTQKIKSSIPIVRQELQMVQPIASTVEEEQLAFDRTIDETATAQERDEQEPVVAQEEQVEKKVERPKQEKMPMDMMKIVLLVGLCVVSGGLLIYRMKKK